ncbi:MAG: NAD-dependent epimerase/dehydratase family protein [Roseiflexaceae bacterium]
METERFLVTGALGCIGAWAVRRLVDQGTPVWTYDLPGSDHRLRLVLRDDQLAQVRQIPGDITDQAVFERAVAENGITHIVHLAGLQVPFVRADPVQGARVNVVGTTIVFETAKRHAGQVRGLAYASSLGVYGPPDLYPPGPLAHDAPLHPPTLYGVFKQANEGTAQIYWQEYRIPSIGLRPYVVYGPGRDQGMTSTPTKAMLAAAVGWPYHISYGGRVVFQHADDAAESFIRAARQAGSGAPVYTLGGSSATMAEIVTAIEAAVPQMRGKITFEPIQLPNPEDVASGALDAALGPLRWVPLAEGVRRTIEHFQAAIEAGRIDVERAIA